jgi:hypothetical protein
MTQTAWTLTDAQQAEHRARVAYLWAHREPSYSYPRVEDVATQEARARELAHAALVAKGRC